MKCMLQWDRELREVLKPPTLCRQELWLIVLLVVQRNTALKCLFSCKEGLP